MSNTKTTLTKRLDRLTEVLTGTTNYSKYAHTVYEASAELDGQAAQVAMLREALDHISVQCVQSDIAPDHYLISKVEFDQTVPAALNATAADVEAWQAARAAK